MNSKHRATLEAVFATPTPATLAWRDIEALFVAVECEAYEGRGSRVRFEAQGFVAYFHRPHPGKEAKPYQVRLAREFLTSLGVAP